MFIRRVRLRNFQVFGPEPVSVELGRYTQLLGANWAGKTALLEALSRLFSPLPGIRKIRREDFHPLDHSHTAAGETTEQVLWIEADVDISVRMGDHLAAELPQRIREMCIQTDAGETGAPIRIRLTATLGPDGPITEKIEYVIAVDSRNEPLRCAPMPDSDRAYFEVHYLPTQTQVAGEVLRASASYMESKMRDGSEPAANTQLNAFISAAIDILRQARAILDSEIHGDSASLKADTELSDPDFSATPFAPNEIEQVLRELVAPASSMPTKAEPRSLTDGQKTLLHLAMVLARHSLTHSTQTSNETPLGTDIPAMPLLTLVAMDDLVNLPAQYQVWATMMLSETKHLTGLQEVLATRARPYCVGRYARSLPEEQRETYVEIPLP
ncbi:MAG: hypothetical protein Q4C87_10935, partial [Actinomycetaceae bacterium]|nr:hypothetical protein [Actinomycetaceae bacterium]